MGIVTVPLQLTEEMPMDVPEIKQTELMREVVRPQWQAVPKDVCKVTLEQKEKIVEVPTILLEEKPPSRCHCLR